MHDELLAAVYESPEDDAPRAVYADFLLERGDPRGEFIASQLSTARAKPYQRQREHELLAEHRAAWVAPLGVVDSVQVTFERGFPAKVGFGTYNLHAAWSTVHTCHTPPHDDRCHTRGLRTITGAHNDDIHSVAKLTRPLAIRSFRWAHGHPTLAPEGYAAFIRISVLPHLEHLILDAQIVGLVTNPVWLDWIWAAPCTQRLQHLTIPTQLDALGAWLSRLPALPITTLELYLPRGHTTLTIHDRSRLTVHAPRQAGDTLIDLRAMLRTLPNDHALRDIRVLIPTRAEYEASARARANLETRCHELGIALSIEKASR